LDNEKHIDTLSVAEVEDDAVSQLPKTLKQKLQKNNAADQTGDVLDANTCFAHDGRGNLVALGIE
jgi:hypothetical protein